MYYKVGQYRHFNETPFQWRFAGGDSDPILNVGKEQRCYIANCFNHLYACGLYSIWIHIIHLGGFIVLLKDSLYAVILSYKTVFDNKQCRPLSVTAFGRVSYGSSMLAKVFRPRVSSIQKG